MYSLTIQAPTAISHAVLGQFSGTKEQQIVTACGSRITLNRPDATQGKIVPILSHDVFGIIRGLAAFKLAGSNKGMSLSTSLRIWHLVIFKAHHAADDLVATTVQAKRRSPRPHMGVR
jgi:hypothetical protein